MSDTSTVQVYVYDLSHGMMAQMSQGLLGRRLEGLWHTSVVVYGKEYFYGGGIQQAAPGTTPAGSPTKVLNYGTTQVPQELFVDHLHGLRTRFNANAYHLLNNNCNTFTNEAVLLLSGKPIPADILDLPNQFASTPLGGMMTPMIDAMFRNGGGAPV